MKCLKCGTTLGIRENDKYCHECGAILNPVFYSELPFKEKARILRRGAGGFDISISNCETSKITDYKLSSSANGGTKLELTIELDDSTVLIETSAK